MANDLELRLRGLHIRTPLHLCDALELAGPRPMEFADLRGIVKGPLVRALKRICKTVLGELAKRAPTASKGRDKLRLEITRVDVTQVSDIDQKRLTFHASAFNTSANDANVSPAIPANSPSRVRVTTGGETPRLGTPTDK